MPEMLVKVKIPAFTRTLVIVASVLQAISFSTRFIVYFTDYKSIRKLGFLIDMLYIIGCQVDKEKQRCFLRLQKPCKIGRKDQTDRKVRCHRRQRARFPSNGRAVGRKRRRAGDLCRQCIHGRRTGKTYKKKKVVSMVNEKGCRNKPLTDEQKASNKEKSKIRARVEHIFGFVENSMNGSFVRTIGMARAKAKIGMMNLTYNICRCAQLRISVCMG